MFRICFSLAILAFGLFLTGCPDLYPRVRDVEFEGGSFVQKPVKNPFASSPVLFPADWESKPRASGTQTVTDPQVAKALLALKPGRSSRPAKTEVRFTTYEGPYGPWFYRWLDKYARRVERTRSVCPLCLSPYCTGDPCYPFGTRSPTPQERLAWKLRMKSRGVIPSSGGSDPSLPGRGFRVK
ncbi:MAG: hypothetical protein ACYS47_06350 [Planctomycetota bacterium]|jgi:hypothetical protein